MEEINEKKKIEFKSLIKKLIEKKFTKYIIAAASVVIALTLLFTVPKTSVVKFDAEANLMKALDISEFSTVDYIYNSVAESKNKKDKVDYWVKYQGTVKAGIDFSEIKITENKEEKIITAVLPKVKIFTKTVDPESMDYIFLNKKAETESIAAESLKLCKEDINAKIDNNNKLFEIGKENAVAVVTALLEPVVEQIGYRLIVK